MTQLVEMRNVRKVFGEGLRKRNVTVAVDDISLGIEEGYSRIIAIAGESGSGKSSMAMLMLGFYTPTTGEVLYRGKDIHALSGEEMFSFRKEVQAIFQDPFAVYNPFYKVDNLLSIPIKNFKLTKSASQTRDMMHQALSEVGLRPEETLGRFPHQLSGGQRQRIAVARALLLKPKLLIADEPVSMVDASLRATILKALSALNREYKVPVLYITHDLTTAYHVSDHIMILYRGSVMEAGNVDLIIKEPMHPYTRLLVGSIAWPDPNLTWAHDLEKVATKVEAGVVGVGCKFAASCRFAFAPCTKTRPPLYRTDPYRAAACFLYESSDVVPGNALDSLFQEERSTLQVGA